MAVRYVKDTATQRRGYNVIYAIVIEGKFMLLIDAEEPSRPPVSLARWQLDLEERFVEIKQSTDFRNPNSLTD